MWEIVLHPLTILAAAQLLQVRERAPRWYRRMIVTGALFLPLIPLFEASRTVAVAGLNLLQILNGSSGSRRRGACGGSDIASARWAS